jgi:hypothetical protein
MLWSLSGNISLVHKVLFGIRFDEDKLRFEPFVPNVMGATRKLTNYNYRKAVLDIEMNGFGNRIASFSLDGKAQTSASVPPNLIGKHTVKIVLANNEFENQPINLVKNAFTPLMPLAKLANGKLSWLPIEGVTNYRILKNGLDWKETPATTIDIPANEQGEFQVMAVDKNGISSFASEPIPVYPNSAIQTVEIENMLTPSTLPYHGFSGTGFVEISRTVNRSIQLEIEVTAAGRYAIDWCYANGNGPTNTENKCAIRTLFVDDNRLGAQIFPQRGIGEWSNWEFSNAIQVQLKPGRHTLRLEFMPENENMNIDVNQAMLDYVRLVKIE